MLNVAAVVANEGWAIMAPRACEQRSLRFLRRAGQRRFRTITSGGFVCATLDHDDDLPSLKDLQIFEGDELIFDGSDPDTYIVFERDSTFRHHRLARQLGGRRAG
jgi:hypothetical protein